MTDLALPRVRARRRRWRPPGPDWWYALAFVAVWTLACLYNLLGFMGDPRASWALLCLSSIAQLVRSWRLLAKYEGRFRAARFDPVMAWLLIGWLVGIVAALIAAAVEVAAGV